MRLNELELEGTELSDLFKIYAHLNARDKEFWNRAAKLNDEGWQAVADVSDTEGDAQEDNSAGTEALGPLLGSDMTAVEDSAREILKKECMEEYMNYVETGTDIFEAVTVHERTRQNILLDYLVVEGQEVHMNLLCCDSSNPGQSEFVCEDQSITTIKTFDRTDSWFLDGVILAAMSLFIDIKDSSERSEEQGELLRQLSEREAPMRSVRAWMSAANIRSDRSCKSAGAKEAVIECYSGCVLRKDTNKVLHDSGFVEDMVPGWNKHRIRLNQHKALAILESFFAERDFARLAILVADSIEARKPTFSRLFVDMVGVWMSYKLSKARPSGCPQGNNGGGYRTTQCSMCEDTMLCRGFYNDWRTLQEQGLSKKTEQECVLLDFLLSQCIANCTLRGSNKPVRDQLKELHRAQMRLSAAGQSTSTLGINVGIGKLGVLIVSDASRDSRSDFDALTPITKEGVEYVKSLHRGQMVTYALSLLVCFGYRYENWTYLKPQFVESPSAERDRDSDSDLSEGYYSPAKDDELEKRSRDEESEERYNFNALEGQLYEVKRNNRRSPSNNLNAPGFYQTSETQRFEPEAAPEVVWRRHRVRRLAVEWMCRLEVRDGGLSISRTPHRDVGVQVLGNGGNIGAGPRSDFRAMRHLANGRYGPYVLEDMIEQHERGNLTIRESNYNCYVRSRTGTQTVGNTVEVGSIGSINLKNSQRFATDGKKVWYNVTENQCIHCVWVNGLWTFDYSQERSGADNLTQVVPKKAFRVSARCHHAHIVRDNG